MGFCYRCMVEDENVFILDTRESDWAVERACWVIQACRSVLSQWSSCCLSFQHLYPVFPSDGERHLVIWAVISHRRKDIVMMGIRVRAAFCNIYDWP